MWKYTHTDEMYHSLTGKNELFHSDTYLGQDFSDGIRHWKYIKREKVNGRWRYYYKDNAYDKANTAYQKAQKQVDSNHYTVNRNNRRIERNNAIIEDYNSSNAISKVFKRKKVKAAVKENEKTSAQSQKIVDRHRTDEANLRSAKYKREEEANKDTTRKQLAKTGVKVANKLSDASYAVGKQARKGKKAIQKQLNKLKKKKKK